MNKFIGHLSTIVRHRHKVIRHCARAGILYRGLLHDLSKYSPIEFWAGVKYFSGDKSPNVGERIDKGYSEAWLHHQGRNKHHFEFWVDYSNVTHKREPIKMPLKYVKEMFCDRVAASKIYQGEKYTDAHPLKYFLAAKSTRIIHPETSDLIEKLLTMLANEGEDAVFEYIKNLKEY